MEGDRSKIDTRPLDQVSIHAPRMEGDAVVPTSTVMPGSFNPRPPDGGRLHPADHHAGEGFQSTPPGWRATSPPCGYTKTDGLFQSTPPGWRATSWPHTGTTWKLVSIHAPRMEGDASGRFCESASAGFNPRPPDGGRPRISAHTSRPQNVSIHAPRMEGDCMRRSERRKPGV